MSGATEISEPEGRPTPDVVNVLVGNHRQFLAFLEKRVGSRAIAEDILQDAFVRGMGKLDSLRSEESAVAWFYRLLRNAIIDRKRRDGAAERKLAAFGLEVEQHSEPGVELRGAICKCVSDLAATLKDDYADALRSIEVDGVAVKDYAEQAGISTNNAGVRVFRAREALRQSRLPGLHLRQESCRLWPRRVAPLSAPSALKAGAPTSFVRPHRAQNEAV
jgi:RNA polymerase sigma factor (sigma-70 family)